MKQNRNMSKPWKIGEIKDKEVNQPARDSDDALVCCIENTVDNRIMDSGASFHAAYCKEELERFKLRSGKVRLADDKTLDIAGVGDVVLKTSFGISWILKDVRYIPGLKRRLILVGELDDEGYHVGFGDQQWKVTKGSFVVARGNKRGSLHMVEDWEAEEFFLHNVSEDKETAEVRASSYRREPGPKQLLVINPDEIRYYDTCYRNCIRVAVGFGVAERMRGRTFIARVTMASYKAPKMLWADSVSTVYLIYRIPYVLIGLRIPEEEWRGNDTSLAYLKNLSENDSIVAEHGLSLKITQSPCGSSNTSEGSKNSGSFEDSGRSNEEDSEDGASSKKGGSETPQE
ncbi:hypothetical protein Tco_0265028 [Tanacetum coccineum]